MKDKLVLDVGCGSGRLTFAISPYSKKVVGIDISESEIEIAKKISKDEGTGNVDFYSVDAEAIEYSEFLGEEIDVVASNLCMSRKIVERSSRALEHGGPFVFACFHSDQLKELGGSRFSFAEDDLNQLLEASGFIVEYISVEKSVFDLPGKATVEKKYHRYPWAKRRWNELMRYVEKGGRTITQSRLIVKSRKK